MHASNLEVFMTSLAQAGYELSGVNGHTLSSPPDDPDPNPNFPMQSCNFLYQAKGKPDIVLCHYSCHGSYWHAYATSFSGKKPSRYMGFTVTGTREHSLNSDLSISVEG